MNLRFAVTEGARIFVRNVLVSGLESTNPDLVRDRISLEKGDPLSQSQMVESQRSLYDLGIFARVDMAIQNPEGRERNKYVLYQLEEASRYSVKGSIGAQIARIGGGRGATDLTAPAGDVGFSPRVSFGVSRSNFLGIGHTLSFDGRLSTLQRRGLITYLAPQFKGNEDLNLSFNALYEDARDVRTFSAQRLEGSVQLGQRWTRANTAQYRFSYRRVRVDRNTLKITPQLIPLLSQPVRIGVLSGTFIQDRRDDPLDTRRGIYNSIDFGLASSLFGSRTEANPSDPLASDAPGGLGLNFIRLLFRNSTYHRIGRDMVLARTLTLGNLRSFDEGDPRKDVPLPERFFAGGASSHRGFPDNQAGPRDLTTGFPIGGKAVLVHSTELRFPLIGDNIGGVLFHDAGNVYSSLNKLSFRFSQRDLTDFDYAVQAVGIGLRYRTPVGPVRLDLAFGINSPRFMGFKGTREELLFGGGVFTEQRISRFQFHFSLGQAF
jgi:outer membrane protein assembly factor BamA